MDQWCERGETIQWLATMQANLGRIRKLEVHAFRCWIRFGRIWNRCGQRLEFRDRQTVRDHTGRHGTRDFRGTRPRCDGFKLARIT